MVSIKRQFFKTTYLRKKIRYTSTKKILSLINLEKVGESASRTRPSNNPPENRVDKRAPQRFYRNNTNYVIDNFKTFKHVQRTRRKKSITSHFTKYKQG